MERPKSILQLSPNYTPRNPGRTISCVILHATAGGKESSLEWLCTPQSKVSAHYLIDTLGAIYHLVHEQNVAWHAGVSSFNGLDGVNEFSVGIELVNANDGKMLYSNEQIESCLELVSAICIDFKIDPSSVVGHADIAPGRKTDPMAFPWTNFRTELAKRIEAGEVA